MINVGKYGHSEPELSWGKEVQGQANWAPQQACSTQKLAKLNFCGKPCCIVKHLEMGNHPWAHLIQKAPIPLILLQTWIVVEFLPCIVVHTTTLLCLERG
jgi:hypothetical protein